MFNRKILDELNSWKVKSDRKPLVIRGARQVGKTTVVNMFSKQFDNYIYLNLENSEDSEIFKNNLSFDKLLEAIFFLKNIKKDSGQVLIFIDEIQNVPNAVKQLRYFYEKARDLFVIAAGSLLETLFNKKINFPVGRVEYLTLKPLSFEEFLSAIGEEQSVEMLNTIPLPKFAHKKLLELFHRFVLIGGMPEVVKKYVETNDLLSIDSVYDSLIISYLDDVEKYYSTNKNRSIIRYVINNSFYEAGNRIKFQGFGKSNYKSREISESLQLLEKTFLIYLIYPTTSTNLPIIPDRKKSPRLQLLDTGLLNHFLDVKRDIYKATDINNIYKGKISEHIVGQELLATSFSFLYKLYFWVREKKQSNAEVDFVIRFNNCLIPIEVKSGKTGRLRSLHQFIDQSPHKIAVRLYPEKVNIDNVKTINKTSFKLLNLPYFLASKIDKYLEWMI
ncbi:MAG: AAA family ATPase [Candidatus Marinimicrobia bacterium]|nr:AAA family ATPase [Candidatus Neomarinimicrobiota bacterium]